MEIQINSRAFIIDEFSENQWFWLCREADSTLFFESACHAMQNAIYYVQYDLDDKENKLASKIEDECFGSYEDQVRKEYDYAIRH